VAGQGPGTIDHPDIDRLAMRARPLVAYAILYGITLASLVHFEALNPAEPLAILGIIGVGFSGLAWWTTRGLVPRAVPVRAPRREGLAALGYLAALAVFITWVLPAVRTLLPPGWPAELLVLVTKLAVFVATPIVLWPRTFGYPVNWRPTVLLAVAIILFQALASQAGNTIAASDASAFTLVLVLLAGFVWLVAAVGVVEEVAFRGFLQTRLAAWASSELTGLVAAALLFGLAHAPGLYLRPALTGEHVGTHPSLLMAVGYSIVYTSVAGLFYGVLWLRTRNLWVVALVHAAQDLLPAVATTLRQGYPGA